MSSFVHSAVSLRINSYLAILVITLFGTGAVFLITRVADDVEQHTELITSSYESSAFPSK